MHETISLIITIIVTASSAVWLLSKELSNLHNSIDKIDDALREYILSNNYVIQSQKDRITALKFTTKDAIDRIHSRLSDMEKFLEKNHDFRCRVTHTNHVRTEGDFHDIPNTNIDCK